jgi:hypothetical protein
MAFACELADKPTGTAVIALLMDAGGDIYLKDTPPADEKTGAQPAALNGYEKAMQKGVDVTLLGKKRK